MSFCNPIRLSLCNQIKNNSYTFSEYQEKAEPANDFLYDPSFCTGLLNFGHPNPIKEAVNPDCRDPIVGKPPLKEFLPVPGDLNYGRQAERFHFLDIHSGLVNGINYGKFNRLLAHKKKHARSPFAPYDKFCTPVTSSMSYGWWMGDINSIDMTKYLPNKRYPQKRSEMTIFVDEMSRTTPNFILF